MKWMLFTTAAAFLLVAASGCGSDRDTELTDEQIRMVSDAAGLMARNIAYPPDSEGWSPLPDENTMATLEALSSAHVDLWPRFFRAAADTSLKLLQLEDQARQEALQMEML